jgi:cysteinyl-tRNA synthetase
VSSRRTFLQGAAAAAIGAWAPLQAGRAAVKKGKNLPYIPIEDIPNHRQYMRDVVIALADYCKKRRPEMAVLVRNGAELLIKEQREDDWQQGRDPDGYAMGRYSAVGSPDGPYLAAIDGMVIDALYYGRDKYDQPTRADDAALLAPCAELMHREGRRALLIDYCKDPKHRADAAARAQKAHLLAFLDGSGDKTLSHIPEAPPATENAAHVTDLSKAQNFLPLLSSAGFGRRDLWFDALAATNYDILMIDPFWRGSSMTIQDVRALKFKRLGSQRLIYASLPIGYAAVDRFYWQKGWRVGIPDFIAAADPDETSRFITYYWLDSWKKVLGNYVTGLCDLGIDGIVLDGLESYLYFEAMMPF